MVPSVLELTGHEYTGSEPLPGLAFALQADAWGPR